MTTPSAVPSGSRRSIRENLQALRAAGKPSLGTPLYSRWVNRPAGRVLAAVAARLGLSPNTVSLLSGACSLAAIVLIATNTASVGLALAVTGLLVLGYALDSADGQVARLTGTGSPLGEWLDHMIDAAKIAALHSALVWHVVAHTDLDRRWALVPLGYLVVSTVLFFGMILTDQLRRAAGLPKASGPQTRGDLVKALVLLPSDYGFLCLSFLLFGWTHVFFPVYAVFLAGNAVLLVAALARWVRQLSALGTAR